MTKLELRPASRDTKSCERFQLLLFRLSNTFERSDLGTARGYVTRQDRFATSALGQEQT